MYLIDTQDCKIMINSKIDDSDVGDAGWEQKTASPAVIMKTYDFNPYFDFERGESAPQRDFAAKA